MSALEGLDRLVFTVDIPGQPTAATPDEWLALVCPVRGRVVQVDWVPEAAITAAAASFNVTVRNRGANGAGATNIALRAYTATNGVAWVAETQPLVVLHATLANRIVAKGDVLTVEKTINAGGLAMPAGIVVITIAPN
jgi:hypothetical protein